MIIQIIYNVAIALIILCFIVTIHELGHYLVGRMFNLKIREFSVGILGVKFLPSWTDSRNTIWRIGLLPVGGYVSFVEQNPKNKKENESQEYNILDEVEKDKNIFEMVKSRGKEMLESLQNSAIFRFGKKIFSKAKNGAKLMLDDRKYTNTQIEGVYLEELHPLKKILLAIAGPLANFVLGFIVFAGLYMFVGRNEKEVRFAEDGSSYTAQDVIVGINGTKIMSLAHLKSLANADKINVIDFKRNGQIVQTSAIQLPKVEEADIGIVKMDAYTAVTSAANDLINIIRLSFTNLFSIFGKMFNLDFKGTEKLSGIIGIVRNGFKEIEKGLYFSLKWMALLSISLGVMNLLIIPPFDGSFIIFSIIEMLVGKKQKLEDLFSEVAMIVILFFAFVTIRNDIFIKNRNEKQAEEEVARYRNENVSAVANNLKETKGEA